MELQEDKKETVEFEDAYTGELKYGRVEHLCGSDAIIRIISKEEAGPNPRRLAELKPDPRIAELTGGTGRVRE